MITLSYEQAYQAIVRKMPPNFDEAVEGRFLDAKLRTIEAEDLSSVVEQIISNEGWTDYAVASRIINQHNSKAITSLQEIAKQEANKIYRKMISCFEIYDNLRWSGNNSLRLDLMRFDNFLEKKSGKPTWSDKELEALKELKEKIASSDYKQKQPFEALYTLERYHDNTILQNTLEQIILDRMIVKHLPTALPQAPAKGVFARLARLARLRGVD